MDCLDGLHLHDDRVVHQKIEPQTRFYPDAVILNW